MIDLNRFQRGQSEVLQEFTKYLIESGVITDDTMLMFMGEFAKKYDLSDDETINLADYFTTSARDFIGEQTDLLGYLVFKEEDEKRMVERVMETELVREEIREMKAEQDYEMLPPHITNLLETHETLDNLADSLNQLTPESSLSEVGVGFGFETGEEFLEVIKRDMQITEEMANKAKELTVETPFADYVTLVGGQNALVALDAMRMDIVRTINNLTS